MLLFIRVAVVKVLFELERSAFLGLVLAQDNCRRDLPLLSRGLGWASPSFVIGYRDFGEWFGHINDLIGV